MNPEQNNAELFENDSQVTNEVKVTEEVMPNDVVNQTTAATEADVNESPVEKQEPQKDTTVASAEPVVTEVIPVAEETAPVESVLPNPEPTMSISDNQTDSERLEDSASSEIDSSQAPEKPVDEAPATPAGTSPIEVTETPEVKSVETPVEGTASSQDSQTEAEDREQKRKSHKQEKLNEVYNKLAQFKENDEIVEVEVVNRIRGGLRVKYEDAELFLPASHFSLKRTPTEQDLHDAVGQKLTVHIHELQEYDEGRKAVIVSRKRILADSFWDTIKVGDHVEGKVSSVASFGVFLDLGGVEGLIHISRLYRVHVDDPNTMFKKGDNVQAVVVELSREKNRIALSRKELEESPWKNLAEELVPGTKHNGIVRRLTDFGAYIELKPGVDGLLRTPEISWTKRVKKPSDALKPGDEIMVEILSISIEKQTISLSHKSTLPNPWLDLKAKYPVGSEYEGTITQVIPQGMIVSLNEEIDGFMPRSKMKNLLRGNKIPYHPGEKIQVAIADLIPDEESLILLPVINEEEEANKNRKQVQSGNDSNKQKAAQGNITLVDLISDTEKKSLFKSLND